MSIYCPPDPPELASVLSRIRMKRNDYERYGFSEAQGRALWAFFDLAQEYETIDNFYCVCVFVPKGFLGMDCGLYLVDQDTGRLEKACDSVNGLQACGTAPPEGIHASEAAYDVGDSYITPIRGNRRLIADRPLDQGEDIIGMFEVLPVSRLTARDRLFFDKYANRIGYNLHYKTLAIQNVRHLRFINTLVADIEHNVIAPNIHYRVFLNDLHRKIREIEDVRRDLRQGVEVHLAEGSPEARDLAALRQRLRLTHCGLLEQYRDMKKHYRNTSLFLESLLRRDHFERGELVLRRRPCHLVRDVIEPQVRRFVGRFLRRGIAVEGRLGGMPQGDVSLVVDLGLISQVYANFLSNAEKYCREVVDEDGKPVKFVAYHWTVVSDFFGPGKPGVKFGVLTSGPSLSQAEGDHVFDEGFRGEASKGEAGSGHGLHFVKKVVEVHGGVAGHETHPLGNDFFVVLPLQADPQGAGTTPVEGPAEVS